METMASTSKTESNLDDGGMERKETSAKTEQNPDDGCTKSKETRACLMSRMAINDNKAGMEGLDKEKINQIIYEASKGSKFFENERKKEEQLDIKIQRLKSYANQFNPKKLDEGKVQADLLLDKLKMERSVNHTIVHVDMDAFYAAVEMKDNPSLKFKPMAVGGMGMLSTSNYLARKFGVRAAMPGFIGIKLCPNLVIVKPNFDKYTSVSREVRKILSLYDPNFCPMSLDEAYLDFGQHLEKRASSLISERTFILRKKSDDCVDSQSNVNDKCLCDLNSVLLPSILNSDIFLSLTYDEREFQSCIDKFDCEGVSEEIPTTCGECKRAHPGYNLKVYGLSIEDAVLEMRNRIEQRTQLTASAGIAPNMMLAKICSDKNKPDGQFRILPDIEETEKFIQDLPIRKVSGIGKVTEKMLGGLGVIKCSDIYKQRSLLYHLFSPTSFHHFLRISLGMGSTIVERDDERKSISTERTFSEISDVAELCSKCDELCSALTEDLKQENIKGKTLTLKLKTISFEMMTRSITLQDFTNDEHIITNYAKKLLHVEIKNSQPAPLRLRLMGVRMSKLISQNNTQATVSSMFNKHKGRETGSTQQQSQNHDHNFVHEFGSSMKYEDFSVQDEGEEDFRCPATETSNQTQNHKTNLTKDRSSPRNTNKETKKGETSSLGNILHFFSRQKGVNCEQSKGLAAGRDSIICQAKSEAAHPLDLELENSSDVSNGVNLYKLDSLDDNTDTQEEIARDLFTCPICGISKSEWDLQSLNSHIDVCLSHQTIKDMLQNEKVEQQAPKTKRLRPDESTKDSRHPGKVRKIQSSVLSYFQS